jgi:hypothetical protein
MVLTLMTLAIAVSVERVREYDTRIEAPRWLALGAAWLRARGGRVGQFLLGEVRCYKFSGTQHGNWDIQYAMALNCVWSLLGSVKL